MRGRKHVYSVEVKSQTIAGLSYTRNLKDKAEQAVDWLEKQIQVAKELYKISPEKYYQHFKVEVEDINKDMDKTPRETFHSVKQHFATSEREINGYSFYPFLY